MRTSDQVELIFAAMAAFQGDIGTVEKDSANPFFKSRYASFSACRKEAAPALAKHGLAVVQDAPLSGECVELVTRILHKSGQWIETGVLARPKDGSPQAVSATISYLRRIGYCAALGLVADDDDDGNDTRQGMQQAVNAVVQGQKEARYNKADQSQEEALFAKLKANNIPDSKWLRISDAFDGKLWTDLRRVVESVK